MAPCRSRLLLAFLSAAQAGEFLIAVARCTGCGDPRHPIHAWLRDVEAPVTSA